VSTLDCKHHRTLLIHASIGSGGREHLDVCADCGEFNFFAEEDGKHFSTKFRLWSSAVMMAASQAYRLLREGVKDERLTQRVYKPLDFGQLRLYKVIISYQRVGEQRMRRDHHIVAATAPRYAAQFIEEAYKEAFDNKDYYSQWYVSGYPLDVWQPQEWKENGIPLINEKLAEEIERQRAAVVEHHSQKADDRCIEDDTKLYAAFGLPPADHRVGSKIAMLENCARFIAQRCEGGGWPSYVKLEARIKELEAELEGLRANTN
jgi:hypothetical protein